MTCEGSWGDSEREIDYSEQDWSGLNTRRCPASEISQTSGVAWAGAQIKLMQWRPLVLNLNGQMDSECSLSLYKSAHDQNPSGF